MYNKKKNASRFCAIVLAIMFVLSTATTAFAATPQETDMNTITSEIPENATVEYTEEFILDGSEGLIEVNPRSWTSESFVYTQPRRGSDRKFDGNYAAFEVTVIAEDGTAVRQKLDVRLYKYDSPYLMRDCQVEANGVTHKEDWIAINNKATYYFQYQGWSYGSEPWKPMKVTMTFYSWE